MDYYLICVGAFLIVFAFLVWRLRVELSLKQPLGQSLTCLVYLIPWGVITLIRWITPPWPEALHSAVLLVWVIACGTVSYKLHRKYNQWLEAEKEKEKENE